jgi:hypothetical protein
MSSRRNYALYNEPPFTFLDLLITFLHGEGDPEDQHLSPRFSLRHLSRRGSHLYAQPFVGLLLRNKLRTAFRRRIAGCDELSRLGGEQVSASPRTLIYFPIIHTQADMGALGETVRRSTLQTGGLAAWKRKVAAVDRRWTEIERIIEDLRIPYASVRLYQDGLPVCGKEMEIVSDLANSGSRNHRLLLHLLEKGATVMGSSRNTIWTKGSSP